MEHSREAAQRRITRASEMVTRRTARDGSSSPAFELCCPTATTLRGRSRRLRPAPRVPSTGLLLLPRGGAAFSLWRECVVTTAHAGSSTVEQPASGQRTFVKAAPRNPVYAGSNPAPAPPSFAGQRNAHRPVATDVPSWSAFGCGRSGDSEHRMRSLASQGSTPCASTTSVARWHAFARHSATGPNAQWDQYGAGRWRPTLLVGCRAPSSAACGRGEVSPQPSQHRSWMRNASGKPWGKGRNPAPTGSLSRSVADRSRRGDVSCGGDAPHQKQHLTGQPTSMSDAGNRARNESIEGRPVQIREAALSSTRHITRGVSGPSPLGAIPQKPHLAREGFFHGGGHGQ